MNTRLLASANLAILIGTLVIARSLAFAEFLSRFGIRELAVASIAVGLVSLAVVPVLDRFTRRYGTFAGSLAVLIVLASFCGWLGCIEASLTQADRSSAIALFYFLIETLAYSSTLQFWSLINKSLHVDAARHSYVTVGSGGIVGSLLGGVVCRSMVGLTLAHFLLVLASLFILQIGFLLLLDHQLARIRRRQGKSASQWNFAAARSSNPPAEDYLQREEANDPAWRRLERSYFGAAFALVLATTFIDFHFKLTARDLFVGDVSQLTAYFGDFYLVVGLTTLVVQQIITPIFLHRRRVTEGLHWFPRTLALSLCLYLLVPGPATARLLKLNDSVMSHSVYRSCMELTLVPIPTRRVAWLKFASEGLVGRVGLITAALFVFFLDPWINRFGSFVFLPLVGISIVLWHVQLGRFAQRYEHFVPAELSVNADLVESVRMRKAG